MSETVSIVALSGGIDSAYILAKILKETDDQVFVHHVHIKNSEYRWEAEAEACEKIVKYCYDNYRKFHYSESTVDRLGLIYREWDVVTIAGEMGALARGIPCLIGENVDYVYTGFCTEDYKSISGGVEIEDHIDGILKAYCHISPAPVYKRHEIISKKEQMVYMGQELSDMCWGCRRPIEKFQKCNSCHTCKIVTTARNELGWSY